MSAFSVIETAVSPTHDIALLVEIGHHMPCTRCQFLLTMECLLLTFARQTELSQRSIHKTSMKESAKILNETVKQNKQVSSLFYSVLRSKFYI